MNASPLVICVEDPDTADAATLLAELSQTLSAITGSSGTASFDVNDVRAHDARFVVARDQTGRALGCGAFRPLDTGVAEIKRMFARQGRSGVGSAILLFLEKEALKLGYAAVRLETRRVNAAAVRFYELRGYNRIANYGKYAGRFEAVCFEKRLAPERR